MGATVDAESLILEAISIRRQLWEELEAANIQLKAAHQQKDRFMAMLSHELRNPLAPILTALELFRLRTDHSDLQKPREIIERQVRHIGGPHVLPESILQRLALRHDHAVAVGAGDIDEALHRGRPVLCVLRQIGEPPRQGPTPLPEPPPVVALVGKTSTLHVDRGPAAVVVCRADQAHRYTSCPVHVQGVAVRTRRFGTFGFI